MFLFKRFKIRSYEVGLYFRDGEFRGLLGAGRHWLFDPLGKVRVDVVSQRDAVARPREARRDRQVRCARRPRRGPRPEGLRAGPGLDRRPLQPHPAAGPVRLLDGREGRARRGRRRAAGALRARGPQADHRASPHGRAACSTSARSSANHVGVLFIDGEYVETLPPGQYAFWKNVADVEAWSRSTCARRRSTSPARRS